MTTESIWTALPTGRTRGTLTLSVHVTPRLTSAGGADGILDDHDAFVTWPPADLAFSVVVGATTFPSTAVEVVSTPDPILWSKLFPPTSLVRSHVPVDRGGTTVHSYSPSKIAAFLKARYTATAIDSPEDHPAITGLLNGGFDRISHVGRTNVERWNAARAQLSGLLLDEHVVDTRAPSTPTFDFVALEDFFAPLDGDDPAVAAEYAKDVEPPKLDFHAAVQFVNQHPPLLRLLGLAFDLTVDVSAAPPANGPVDVRVVPSAAALDPTVVRTPRTRASVTAAGFTALPRPGTTHLVPGWMRFEDSGQFEVISVDVDGGGLKAVDFASNQSRTQVNPTEDTPTEAALPVLRQDGFSVARKGAAQELSDTFATTAAKETALAANTLQLFLDDLTRGVRVDVWDSTSTRWHSVMDRRGTYELAGSSIVISVVDEGMLGTTASKKPLSDDLYVTEELFWWDGWSLAVPRPGKVLRTDADPDPLIERPPNDPGPDFDAKIRFDFVEGTLPRLRHGVDYRFRARLVDLAGNSLPAASDDVSHATSAVRFGRFEPPATPPVVLRHPVGPGESVETVVLRSHDLPPVPPSPPTSERHIVPPKVGQMTVELHGLIDKPDPAGDIATWQQLADLDAAMLQDTYGGPTVTPTWAPEPVARQLALKLLDGPHAGHLTLAPMVDPSAWPAALATRLVVQQGTAAPTLAPGVLTVPLRKADIVHARLSPVIDVDDLDRFAMWQWILDALPPGPAGIQKRNEQLALIATGEHQMLEPFRVLTLVHAVRQPLARPDFTDPLQAPRLAAQTFTPVSGTLSFHRTSTGRIDVLASWKEPVDGGPATVVPAPIGSAGATVVDRQTAFSFDLEYAGAGLTNELIFRERHELGDTKHRVITYGAVATSRFTEFFTTTAELAWGGPGDTLTLNTGAPSKGVVAGSVKLTAHPASGPTIVPAEGRHFTVDATTGTITFGSGLPGQVPAIGAPVTAVYLVPPVTRSTGDVPPLPGIGPEVLSVPSSARPQAPKVRYVIPTFGWEDDEVTSGGEVVGLTSTRRGNGVRIYMERPWWSSGDGELLGVVLWPPGEQADPPDLESTLGQEFDDRRRPLVTQWGQDPIYGSRLLPARYPRLASFPDAVATDTGLTLGELGSSTNRPVNVAGHTVAFDESRDLWYCDVTVQPGAAYNPLIRLALARWQPASIVKAELSRVVLADVVQLAPDRFASVVFDELDAQVVGVSLSGPTHTRTAHTDSSDPGSAQVIVEQRRSDVGGSLGWKQVGSAHPMTAGLVNGVGHWTGEVTLPGPRAPGKYRLVIEQFEVLGRESSTGQAIPTARLVHTDVIAL